MLRRCTADFLRRLLAGGLAVTVFALTLLAASPSAHERLHDSNTPRADDRCAVVLFADGLEAPLGAIAVPLPDIVWQVTPALTAEEIFLSSPRFLRQPERGPPALG